MDPLTTAVAAILRIERVRQYRARRKAGLACFQIEADEAGLCDATSRAMKRATGQPDPMD